MWSVEASLAHAILVPVIFSLFGTMPHALLTQDGTIFVLKGTKNILQALPNCCREYECLN